MIVKVKATRDFEHSRLGTIREGREFECEFNFAQQLLNAGAVEPFNVPAEVAQPPKLAALLAPSMSASPAAQASLKKTSKLSAFGDTLKLKKKGASS